MAKIAFIGLGHMGGGMAPNLAQAGHEVRAFDLVAEAIQHAAEGGCAAAASAAEAVKGADVVITMLPAAQHVRAVFENDVAPNAKKGALLIDCSTIDVASAREVGAGPRGARLRLRRRARVRGDRRGGVREPDLHGRRQR